MDENLKDFVSKDLSGITNSEVQEKVEVPVVLNDFPEPDEKIQKEVVLRRIRDTLGVREKVARTRQRFALIVAASALFLSASCTKIGANLEDPFLDNNPKIEEVNRAESKSIESTEDIEVSLEKIWDRALRYWPHTRLEDGGEYLFEQARRYSEMYPQYSKELLLGVFTSIAMTESNGGIYLDANTGGNPDMVAKGWFQVVPYWHIDDFNSTHGTNYTSEDLIQNDQISIEVGTWALMRYAGSYDLRDCLKIFKSGTNLDAFGQWDDDGIWWNRVSYSLENLLGRDVLDMGKTDYLLGMQPYSANDFLSNPEHIGNVYVDKH